MSHVFPGNRVDISCEIVSLGDNVHEISNKFSRTKKKKDASVCHLPNLPKECYSWRGMDTFSGEATLTELLVSFLIKGSSLKGMNWLPIISFRVAPLGAIQRTSLFKGTWYAVKQTGSRKSCHPPPPPLPHPCKIGIRFT